MKHTCIHIVKPVYKDFCWSSRYWYRWSDWSVKPMLRTTHLSWCTTSCVFLERFGCASTPTLMNKWTNIHVHTCMHMHTHTHAHTKILSLHSALHHRTVWQDLYTSRSNMVKSTSCLYTIYYSSKTQVPRRTHQHQNITAMGDNNGRITQSLEFPSYFHILHNGMSSK